MMWVNWPKGSSNIRTDLNREMVRKQLLDLDLVDIKVAAIDVNWSGLKFVYRKKEGILVFAGRTLFGPGEKDLMGIAVIRASSPEEAGEILSPDPAVAEGIQDASIFPFSMGIRYIENLP